MPAEFVEVLEFWFGAQDSGERGRPRKAWFEKSQEFDRDCRRFADIHARGLRGELRHWEKTPLAALALVISLDQLPRNIYRGTPRAFAGDTAALRVARDMVERGFDASLTPVERVFAYLPFEHAEDLAAQRRSLALFESLRDDAGAALNIDYARRHYDIVARFGRFPHRNAILGRPSTPEELDFLSQPGSSF